MGRGKELMEREGKAGKGNGCGSRGKARGQEDRGERGTKGNVLPHAWLSLTFLPRRLVNDLLYAGVARQLLRSAPY